MITNIHPSWKTILKQEFEKSYFKELTKFVDNEYNKNECFPPINQVFAAFNACPFDQVKVVVIGQDPYHDVDQAHGLCFSVNEGVSHPPSLKNIFKELKEDIGIEVPESGNL